MKVIIVGGGASGLMCAVSLSKEGHSVTLIEKNEKLGKKLYITGKGRCNLTNAVNNEEFLNNIISNPKFMTAPLKNFSAQDCMDFFENNLTPLKIERGNRVFPLSDKSVDILKCFEKLLKDGDVTVRLNEKVIDFKIENNIINKVITNKNEYFADAVVLATGGISYSATGSDGDGYRFLNKLNHTIIKPVAGLTDIILSNAKNAANLNISLSKLPKLQGLSLKNVSAKIFSLSKNKVLFEEFGEMLFTDKGVSGPIILTLSSKINRMDFRDLELRIDLKPALSYQSLDERVIRDFNGMMNKNFKNALDLLLPKSLIPFLIELSCIDEDLKINVVNKKQRLAVVELLKNLTFKISSLGDLDRAIITAGGLDVKEVNPKNMQSKIVPNLYIIGELLDVDALTGGFNLQIAFSTARQVKIEKQSEV